MRDIIQLLPDAVANQIAAGEVVQRPASVVKELLENSIDAGATEIKLIVKDAGKTLIQVIDNGKGMTETDARMAFERHATSKIRKAEDLFKITSMGFRGEALASIAAVAQVECKTKREEDDLGTELKFEGTANVTQGYCQTPQGTIIAVKNLFFNIPARRNFLKSDQVELKHIIDEFERVAIAHSDLEFSLTHNQNIVFHLPAGNLRKRISGIFGAKYNERLVPVDEQTDIVKVSGFVIKPEHARKTRGEQFFFVNNRFIRNNYLHHAISEAYKELLMPDQHPGYFLFMEIDPARIDVNIHPTKTEIKFDDEKSIYAIIRSSVKHALGQFNVTPAIDFERENAISVAPLKKGEPIRFPSITVNPDFNPFDASPRTEKRTSHHDWGQKQQKVQSQNWEALFTPQETPEEQQLELEPNWNDTDAHEAEHIMQVAQTYLLKATRTGMLLIHQQRAHHRILYERFLKNIENQSAASQQLLFPQQISITAGELQLIESYLDDLRQIGFDIERLGKTTLVIQGIPLALQEGESLQALEEILENLKHDSASFSLNKSHQLALVLARHGAVKAGKPLSVEEMIHLAGQLFTCQVPQYDPIGRPTLITITNEEISKKFN